MENKKVKVFLNNKLILTGFILRTGTELRDEPNSQVSFSDLGKIGDALLAGKKEVKIEDRVYQITLE